MDNSLQFHDGVDTLVVGRRKLNVAVGLDWAHGDKHIQKDRKSLSKSLSEDHSAEYFAWFKNDDKNKNMPESFYAWVSEEERILKGCYPALGYIAIGHYQNGLEDIIIVEKIEGEESVGNRYWLATVINGIPEKDTLTDDESYIAKQVKYAKDENWTLLGSGVVNFSPDQPKNSVLLSVLGYLEEKKPKVILQSIRNTTIYSAVIIAFILVIGYWSFLTDGNDDEQPNEEELQAQAQAAYEQIAKKDLLPATPSVHFKTASRLFNTLPPHVGLFINDEYLCNLSSCTSRWRRPSNKSSTLDSFVDSGAVGAIDDVFIDFKKNTYQYQRSYEKNLSSHKKTYKNIKMGNLISLLRSCDKVNQLAIYRAECDFTDAKPLTIPNIHLLDQSKLYKKGTVTLTYPFFIAEEILQNFTDSWFSSSSITLSPKKSFYLVTHVFHYVVEV